MNQVISERLLEVQNRIKSAATQAGQDPEGVKLIVVTKGHPFEAVLAASRAGVACFGENYAEEGIEKIKQLEQAGIPRNRVEWHMIGHVQSRKAGMVSSWFDYLHSLDRLKVAKRLSRFAGESNRTLPVLVQLNVSGEESKSGWPAWNRNQEDDLFRFVESILTLENLAPRGLMTIPPFSPDPEAVRPYFTRLRELRERLVVKFPEGTWQELSMGMSSDFEAAIAEGATMVRIGTSIMGPRPGYRG